MNSTDSTLTGQQHNAPMAGLTRRLSRRAAIDAAFLRGYQAGVRDERVLAAAVPAGSVDPAAAVRDAIALTGVA